MIYLDNNATTPIEPIVLEAMMPYLTDFYGNAASIHGLGQRSNRALSKAREQIGDLISCQFNEIVFTSGATEAINLAIKGLLERSKRKQIVTVVTEHSAVIETCRFVENHGVEVIYLPVSQDGLLDLQLLKKSITDETLLVCVMLANNETGVIQPIRAIADLVHSGGAYLLCDATQAVGRLPVSVEEIGVDFMAFSAHKFHGPKGIGALFVKHDLKRHLSPIIHGGDQEGGLRSGTSNVPLIVGFGEAAFVAQQEMVVYSDKVKQLRDQLERQLLQIEGAFVNGHSIYRLYNTLNIGFRDFDANTFIGIHKHIAVSNGSACKSAVTEPSYVLKAMGLTSDAAFGSLRISLSKFTTEEEVVAFSEILQSFVKKGSNL